MGRRCHDEIADRLAPPVGDEPLRRLFDRALVDHELDEAARSLRGEGLDDPVRHGVQIDGLCLAFRNVNSRKLSENFEVENPIPNLDSTPSF